MDKTVNNFNINKNKLGFKGDTMKKAVLSDIERRVKTIDFCSKKLAEDSELEIPEHGKFAKKQISFFITGTNNRGIFSISHNVEDPKNLRDVNIAVQHRNSDRTYNNFGVFTGTKEEVIDYLRNLDIDSTLKSVMNLSDKVDDYYSNL